MANESVNKFQVESVFPLSGDETSVTGHVSKGAFRTGESVSLRSSSGIPLLAPISRIGSAETPVNIIREGQRTSIVLKVEPQHVAPGTVLTGTGDDEAYAATMIAVKSDDVGVGPSLDSELREAEKFLNGREFEKAHAILQVRLEKEPDDMNVNRLVARLHLEGEAELKDEKKALQHIKSAYEHGGAEDAPTLETLAQALGATGEVEHGLRFLERLHNAANDVEAKKYYVERIGSYRKRFHIPDLWEFLDGFGEVIFSSKTGAEIAKAISNGSIPEDAKCRKNKAGALMEIRESVAEAFPEVAELYGKGPSQFKVVDLAIGVVVGVLLGIFLGMALQINPIVGAVAGAVLGGGAAFGFGAMKSKKT